jgi:glycosyltransferase involved in cell wall biosynthesis
MRVLHFYNWGYFEPISCGADVIAANQLEYFRFKGWEVDCVLAACSERDHQAEAFRERFSWVRSVRVLNPPTSKFTFGDQLSSYHKLSRSEGFREVVREGHDLFFTNYVFTAPLLEALPRECKRMLEALDFMTDSFALNERISNPGRDPLAGARETFHRKVELELYRLFDGVLFINEQECRQVEPENPGRTHFDPPMMPWELRREAETPTDPPAYPEETFDLIFVASEAPPNVRGLTFFYREIFVPYLRQRRVHLAVVGKVCNRLEFDDWYVTKLGVVPGDLEAYYKRSKVVIVPILEGSGLSIKTLECLARGRAVATSPLGARGLRSDPSAFLEVDMGADPRGAAEAILDLLGSKPKRQRMQRSARDYYRTHFGRERYFDAMDRAMSSIGIAC